ncbi:phage antirepressor KilAC domain-containing protein [Sphingomonas fennica]|uniref:DNA-binding protein n=1 Tax=Edaphosphingomonas fennica TaxID=114404 RepID=A0A2T4HVR5_9SPHN|nr:phage regulatory protein/antirepressor Ant [Sphingomonas fennica]PTD19896.1 DNA-binding protein [Sphingomonas fennica]
MNDLIHTGGVQTMSSREIADLCEARHNDVVATIVRLFDQGVLRESRKTTRTIAPEGGGRPTQVYDLTKRDTLVVVSGYSAELRAKIIDRWQELEARERPDPMVALNDPATMRGLLLSYSEKVLELEQANAELTPKAEALDRIATADGSLNITAAAKALQVRPKDLFAYLQAHGWIYRRNGGTGYLGYQSKVTTGLLEHKVATVLRGDGSEKIVEQVLVTAKGLTKLAALLRPSAQAA